MTRDNAIQDAAQTRATSGTQGLILFLFAGSGAVGLMYELLWRRMLTLMVGGSIWATSMVLAAFMGGLALGAAVLGSRADRWRNPLRAYAVMEALVGAFALLFLLAAPALREVYGAIAAQMSGGLVAANVARAPIVLVVLLPPTFLMGATFPVLARHYLHIKQSVGAGVSELYFVNTFGAVLGTVLTGFVLIRAVGVRGANLIAIVLSLAIAAVAFAVSRRTPALSLLPDDSHARAPDSVGLSFPPVVALIALAASGFAVLSHEVLWTRVLVYVVGNSTYSFAIMLSGYLIGMALGAGIFRLLSGRIDHPKTAARIQLAAAFVGLCLIPLADRLYGLSQWFYSAAGDSPGAGFSMARQYLLTLLVLAPMTILSGMSFPILVHLFVGGSSAYGRRVGLAYGVNSLGAMAGALCAAFVLIPLLSITGAIVATAAISLVAGLMLTVANGRVSVRRRVAVAVVAAALFPALIAAYGRRIDVGHWMDGRRSRRGEELFYREGVSSTVSVFRDPKGGRKILLIDGVGQVPTDLDSLQVFKLLGHLPFFVQPETKSVLVTAFGGGITAGAVLTHPVERVDVVEICPGVLEASDLFLEENRGARSDPRLTVISTDANEYVRWCGRHYDAIISDSTHPAAAESWVLYTRDFYQACHDLLLPGGVMCQWLPIHRLQTGDLETILRTFQSVFPHTTLWFARSYTLLLGTETPLRFDPTRVQALLEANPDVAADLRIVNLDGLEAILKNLLLDEEAVAALAGEGRVATEDRSPLEFAGQRAVEKYSVPDNLLAIRDALTPSLRHTLAGTTEGIDLVAIDEVRRDYLDTVWAYKSEEPEKALAPLSRALKLLPDDRDLLTYLRWAGRERAKQYLTAGTLKEHAPELGRLAERFPDSAYLQMSCGLALIETARDPFDKNKVQQGIALLQKSVAMAPDDPDILDVVSQACLSMDAFPIAVKLLERLKKIQPDNPAILCNLARAYIGLGQNDKARAALQQVRKIDPTNSSAKDLLSKIGATSGDKQAN